MGPRTLTFVRHLESVANHAIRRIIDHMDFRMAERIRHVPHPHYRLTLAGARTGRDIARALRAECPTFDRCFTSDMVRAIETALIMNPKGGYYAPDKRYVGWEVTEMLRERFWGDLEQPGFEHAKLVKEHNELRERLDIFTWVPPNGEPFIVTMQRVREFLAWIHARRFMNPLCVSHGDYILAVMAVIEGKTSLDTNGHYLWRDEIPHNGCILQYRTTQVLDEDNPRAHNPFYFEEKRETLREDPTVFGPWEKIQHSGKTPDELRKYIAKFPRRIPG